MILLPSTPSKNWQKFRIIVEINRSIVDPLVVQIVKVWINQNGNSEIQTREVGMTALVEGDYQEFLIQ